MKNFTMFLLVVIGLMTLSCSIDYNDENVISTYKGEWSGTYAGDDDKGSWNMTIHENGNIFGSTTSDVLEETYKIYGMLEKNGNTIIVSGTATSGASFTGKMSGNEAEGIWSSAYSAAKAEWKGYRQ